MRSFVQVLTTPTADTPGTTLVLHFDSKRYIIGSLAEGTQRACVQMGARLLKVSECFVTGRTEWQNTGGLIGMLLTLADSSHASQAAAKEEAVKRIRSKAKREGYLEDEEKMRQLEEDAKRATDTTLNIFGPPNLNHTLATARRFVFRKGMPVNAHEIRDDAPADDWAPMWADENIKVWAMSVSPDVGSSKPNGKKRSIDEVDGEREASVVPDDELSPKDRDYLSAKAVVSEMFDSSWRLDTLHETPLAAVRLPAELFVRNPQTNKISKYIGPLPGAVGEQPDPDQIVLVRKPWPGALVEKLPHTEPAKESISYIIRNHMQRGKFNPKRAMELKVPKGFAWSQLTKGENVENTEGQTITPEMVLEPSRVGGGLAVVDLPSAEYIDNLVARAEWKEPKVMEGVGAIVWICGKGVAMDSRLHAFMKEFEHLQHIVSSSEYCPNHIALDSVAASTVRLKQVDPDRYTVPVHDAADGKSTYGGGNNFLTTREKHPLPKGVHIAARGHEVQLEPTIEYQTKTEVAPLNIAETISETPQDVLAEAAKSQEAAKVVSDELRTWIDSLPPGAADAEVITLGTGSALPSKYRNVSATLVTVPGWGNILLDCGENTLGQLRRVYGEQALKQIWQDLKIIVISHMHADHHLGTASVIKAWYEQVHNSQPAPPASPRITADYGELDWPSVFNGQNRLAVVAEAAMQNWLEEYSAVEDYGYSRLAPLNLSAVRFFSRTSQSTLSWYIPPSQLKNLSHQAYNARLEQNYIDPALIGLSDIQAASVKHCHGARATSLTLNTGFKVSYSGDCRPCKAFWQIGKDSTVCIHEATFDDELQGDAEAKQHSTTSEALHVAQNMNAKACVLTHFSQRYQKVPVLERADAQDAPAAGRYELPSNPSRFGSNGGPPEAVKFKLNSDMKVCVAFDYMRVRVGDIGHMEKFTPAL
ncbi:uncharacterized protein MYCGRDRAFT_55565, partial [Zymoseptoria tritici IPO323]